MTLAYIPSGSLRLYRQHFLGLFLIANAFTPLFAAVRIGYASSGASWLWLPDIFLTYLTIAALAIAVNDLGSGRPTRFLVVYSAVASRFGSLLMAAARVAVSAFLVLAAMIIPVSIVLATVHARTSIPNAALLASFFVLVLPPLAWLLVRWSFIAQAVMLGGSTGWEAPGQSARLVRGDWWSVALVYAVLWLATGALIVGALGFVAAVPRLLTAILGISAGAFLGPLVAIGQTLMYIELSHGKRTPTAA